MIHKKCRGALLLDCTANYLLVSPSIKITNGGLVPGVIELDYSKNRVSPILRCKECGDKLCSKDEYENEILEACFICKGEFPPSELSYIEGFGCICADCIKDSNSTKAPINKIILYYGEILKSKVFPTLLTILMKK